MPQIKKNNQNMICIFYLFQPSLSLKLFFLSAPSIRPFFLKRKEEEEKDAERKEVPNQQRTLNKLPTELHCKIFVIHHRLSIQVGAKGAKMCMQCAYTVPTLNRATVNSATRLVVQYFGVPF